MSPVVSELPLKVRLIKVFAFLRILSLEAGVDHPTFSMALIVLDHAFVVDAVLKNDSSIPLLFQTSEFSFLDHAILYADTGISTKLTVLNLPMIHVNLALFSSSDVI